MRLKIRLLLGWMLFIAQMIAQMIAVGAQAAPVQIEPFKATYAVTYRGLTAGNITFELKREGPNRYLYHSSVQPSFLASMVVSSRATEMSRFIITDEGVQPLEWKLEDGTSETAKDGALTFDIAAKRVRGTVENKAVDLTFEGHVQDRMSLQIEVMRALLQDREPGTIPIVDDERIKTYDYVRRRTEKMKTRVGEFDSVVYESTRARGKRLSRMWHAPSLGYLPVRAEQVREGRLETIMQLVSLQGRDTSAQ